MKKKRYLKVLSLLVMFSLLINTSVVSEAKTKLNIANETVCIGESITLKVKNASNTPKWSSSRKSVASVNNKGKVIAKKAGTAKITARVGRSKYTCKIIVPKQYINKTSITLEIGDNKEINIYGISDKDNIVWKTSNKKVATVSDGVINGVGNGIATISGTVNNGKGKTYKCKVVVYSYESPGSKPAPDAKPTQAPEQTTNPTSIPIVTQRPVSTPTPSPSDEIVTFPPVITPKPTSPSYIPVKPSDDLVNNSYNKFAQFLLTYGYVTDDGRYYIAGTEKNSTIGLTMKYHIAYNPTNNTYEFFYNTIDSVVPMENGTVMTLLPEALNNVNIRFLSIDKKNFGCDGSSNLDISKYIDNQNLIFTYNWGAAADIPGGDWILAEYEKNFNKIGSSHFAMSMYYWSNKIRQLNIGLTIQDLGFTSY